MLIHGPVCRAQTWGSHGTEGCCPEASLLGKPLPGRLGPWLRAASVARGLLADCWGAVYWSDFTFGDPVERTGAPESSDLARPQCPLLLASCQNWPTSAAPLGVIPTLHQHPGLQPVWFGFIQMSAVSACLHNLDVGKQSWCWPDWEGELMTPASVARPLTATGSWHQLKALLSPRETDHAHQPVPSVALLGPGACVCLLSSGPQQAPSPSAVCLTFRVQPGLSRLSLQAASGSGQPSHLQVYHIPFTCTSRWTWLTADSTP